MDKQDWLAELGNVILEANKHLWANEGKEVKPYLSGFQTLRWEKEPWEVVDQFVGYFRAPGFTVVYYKGQPVWTNAYGGEGQHPMRYQLADETFDFLKKALKENSNPAKPFRGPGLTSASGFEYAHDVVGTIEDANWTESIFSIGRNYQRIVFSQMGVGGIVIGRKVDGRPLYPWDL